MVKGAVEHRCGMVARPRISAAVWEQLPAIVREALDAASLDQISGRRLARGRRGQDVASGVADGPARRAAGRAGLAEMSKVVGDAVDRLVEIEKQSAQRLRKHHGTEIPTVLIAMLFDAPDDDPGGRRRRPKGPWPPLARQGGPQACDGRPLLGRIAPILVSITHH